MSSFPRKFLILWGLLPLFFPSGILFAKKTEAPQETGLHFKELSPQKKLNLLAGLILSGRYSEAFEKLLEAGNIKVDAKQKNRLAFMRAYLTLFQGNPKEASPLFEELRGKYPEVGPILPYWIARSQRLAGDGKKARETLEKFCGGPCPAAAPPVSNRVAREYALDVCEAGDPSQALEMLGNLFNQTTRELERELTRLDRVSCLAQAGQIDSAYAELKTAFVQAPGGVSRNLLHQRLQALHQTHAQIPNEFPLEDQLARLHNLALQERWVEAARELKGVWGNSPASIGDERLYEFAELYFKARFYREAAPLYERLLQDPNRSEERPELLEKLGAAYARSNQFEKAIEVQKQLGALPDEGVSEKASYKIAFLYADAGECKKALLAFEDFLNRFPKSNKRDESRWQRAWCYYQLSNWQAALQELDSLEQELRRSKNNRIGYWRIKILEKSGKAEEARAAKRVFLENGGENFYQRWEDLVHREGSPQCPRVQPSKSLPSEEILNQSLLPNRNGDEKNTLRELLALGLWEDFFELYQKGKNGAAKNGATENLNAWVNFFSRMERVPSELVWAVMREESHFRPQIRSPAGALGLMQIIPQTGYEIAEDLKLNSYSTDDLYDPVVNLRFGIYYLSKLLDRFSGNLVYAIAAYNAGPEAVDRWTGQKPRKDCEEFIEEIPYRETFHYVRKVVLSLLNYRENPPGALELSQED